MTGICAAVGAQLLGRHGRTSPGFVDPEAYFDPEEFLAELGERETVAVTWRDERVAGTGQPARGGSDRPVSVCEQRVDGRR